MPDLMNGINILLVEDQPVEEELLRAVLEERRHHPSIYAVGDGIEAWQFLKAAKYSTVPLPDIILVNLKDSHAVGELVEDIKRDQVFASIPLIAITAHSDEDDVISSYPLHPDRVLHKGVNLGDLFALADKVEEIVLQVGRPKSEPQRRKPVIRHS